jgi:hypothetical protein
LLLAIKKSQITFVNLPLAFSIKFRRSRKEIMRRLFVSIVGAKNLLNELEAEIRVARSVILAVKICLGILVDQIYGKKAFGAFLLHSTFIPPKEILALWALVSY